MEHINRDMLIPIGVRLAFIPAMIWLGAGEQAGQAVEPGLNLVLGAALAWALISTGLLLYVKSRYRRVSLVVHAADLLLLALIVWNSGGSASPFAYLLPVLVLPAGLYVGAFYSLGTAAALSMFMLSMMPPDSADTMPLLAAWLLAFGSSLLLTLLLGARREARRAGLMYEQAEQHVEDIERRFYDLHRSMTSRQMEDEDTGLKNFRHFRERVMQEISRSRRFGYSCTLCLMGIDELPGFTHRFGEQEAQKAMARIARRRDDHLRDTDLAARQLRDQVVFLFPQTDAREAIVPVRRIVAGLRGTAFGPDNQLFHYSFGLAGFPEDAKDLGGLLRLSAAALERSRRRGPGKVTLATSLWRKIP